MSETRNLKTHPDMSPQDMFDIAVRGIFKQGGPNAVIQAIREQEIVMSAPWVEPCVVGFPDGTSVVRRRQVLGFEVRWTWEHTGGPSGYAAMWIEHDQSRVRRIQREAS